MLAEIDNRVPRTPARVLPWLLSGLAGALDGACALGIGGIHVAFVSGDTIGAGEALARGRGGLAAALLCVVLCFVLGAAAGSALARLSALPRPVVAMGVVAATSACAALGVRVIGTGWGVLPLAAGLGAVDAQQKEAGVAVGLSFVSGALLDLGSRLARPATLTWREDGLRLALWLVFLAASAAGALASIAFGLAAVLWSSAVAAMAAAIVAAAPFRPSPAATTQGIEP